MSEGHHGELDVLKHSAIKSIDFILHKLAKHRGVFHTLSKHQLGFVIEILAEAGRFRDAVAAGDAGKLTQSVAALLTATYSASKAGVPGLALGVLDTLSALQRAEIARINPAAAKGLLTPSEAIDKVTKFVGDTVASTPDAVERLTAWISLSAFSIRPSIVTDPAGLAEIDRILQSADLVAPQPQHIVIDEPFVLRPERPREIPPGPTTVFNPIVITLPAGPGTVFEPVIIPLPHDYMNISVSESLDNVPVLHMDFTPSETMNAFPDNSTVLDSDTPTSDTPPISLLDVPAFDLTPIGTHADIIGYIDGSLGADLGVPFADVFGGSGLDASAIVFGDACSAVDSGPVPTAMGES